MNSSCKHTVLHMFSHLYLHANTPAMFSKRPFEQQLLFPVLFTISSVSTWRMCTSFALWSHKLRFIRGFVQLLVQQLLLLCSFFLLFQTTLNALECASLPCLATLCFIISQRVYFCYYGWIILLLIYTPRETFVEAEDFFFFCATDQYVIFVS